MSIDKIEKGFLKSILILLHYSWRLMISNMAELILYGLGFVIVFIYTFLFFLFILNTNLTLDPLMDISFKSAIGLLCFIIISSATFYSAYAISICFYNYVYHNKSGYKIIFKTISENSTELIKLGFLNSIVPLGILVLSAGVIGLFSLSVSLTAHSDFLLKAIGSLLIVFIILMILLGCFFLILFFFFILLLPVVTCALESPGALKSFLNSFKILKKYFFRNLIFLYALYYYAGMVFITLLLSSALCFVVLAIFLADEWFKLVADILHNFLLIGSLAILWIYTIGSISLYYYHLKAVYEGYDLSFHLKSISSSFSNCKILFQID